MSNLRLFWYEERCLCGGIANDMSDSSEGMTRVGSSCKGGDNDIDA